MNGLNLISSSASASAIPSTKVGVVSTSTAAAGEVVTVTASTSTSDSTGQSSHASNGDTTCSVSLAVGASTGAVVGCLLLATGGFVLWRRKKRNGPSGGFARSDSGRAHEMYVPSEGPMRGHISAASSSNQDILPKYAAELDSGRLHEAHELPTCTNSGAEVVMTDRNPIKRAKTIWNYLEYCFLRSMWQITS